MKLLILAVFGFAATALVAETAQAQTFGFKVGPTWSEIDFDSDDPNEEDPDNDYLSSFGGGGFIRFGFAGLTLQAEVLALTKGVRNTSGSGDFTAETRLKLNYIEIPVTAMFALGSGPYIFAGPTVAFETSCDAELEIEGGEFSGDCDDEEGFEDPFLRKSTDFGAVGGLGFHIPLGPGAALIEGRYTWGLTNINDDPNEEQITLRNRSIAVFAGYAIPLGGR
jgi:hypothetical protein